ncbi:MAG: redoxin domain-containing protein [Pirellulaceae bacterium]|nr:redoxin domain-containing protein [Pirellulaceae bacterium]
MFLGLWAATGCSPSQAPATVQSVPVGQSPQDGGSAQDPAAQDDPRPVDPPGTGTEPSGSAGQGDQPGSEGGANGGPAEENQQDAKPNPQPATGNPGEDPAQGDKPDPALPGEDDFPYANRFPMPDFLKDATWLNTGGPLRQQDLKGKFVLLDFWTYCCINCIHILPELKKLEKKYPNELVVIGVHSAKFDTEKDTKNIEEAILRYEIEHPVINDAEHRIWQMLGVSSWPTVLLIDPQGNAIWGRPGEIKFEQVDAVIQAGLPWYREKGHLDATPIRFDTLAGRQQKTPLRFPGKVLADEPGNRLFITDSNHNRIVITTLDGQLQAIIGSGRIGREDGSFEQASFDHPQGLALRGETLYVADTENHLLRKVDLKSRQVSTIAGVGEQARSAWPGLDELRPGAPLPDRWVGEPKKTALNSPWALWVHEPDLYIAMAGPHQIWKMPLDESEIGPYAGNGREDIVDGPLLPDQPYELGASSFAQPSGLASDGTWLYVADSEGSSIRAVPFDPQGQVRTVVGTADLPHSRLFTFGDQDGTREEALLQHALGVVYHAGQIYVADTYNNKLKVVDAESGATRTLAGTGQPGLADEPAQFDEPAGLSLARGTLFVADTNNHAIRTLDLASGKVGTLVIEGLEPPAAEAPRKPSFKGAAQVQVPAARLKAEDGHVTLNVRLQLPAGYKINAEAPMAYFVEMEGDTGPLDRQQAGRHPLDQPADQFAIRLAATTAGSETVRVAMNYFYCQDGAEGLCKVGSVVFTVPLTVADDAPQSAVELRHVVP